MVNVRVIEGAKGVVGYAEKDPFLDTIAGKLAGLPYDTYTVVDFVTMPVKLGTTRTFTIHSADQEPYSLEVEPVEYKDERVEMTIDWTAESGETLLSTKLKVREHEPMVFGTECSNKRSTILCVSLNCEKSQ